MSGFIHHLNLYERQVRKKLQRGQTIAVIAKELEEEPEVIEKIIDKIKQL